MPKRAANEVKPFKHAAADESPGFLLWKVTALWQRQLETALAELGITQTQYAILASLRWFETQSTPPTQTGLGEHAKIEKMTLSKAIRQLEAKGLVTRASAPNDSRAVTVRFTVKGRKLVQRAVVAIEDADDSFFAALEGRELAVYKSLARRLISGNDPPIGRRMKSPQ